MDFIYLCFAMVVLAPTLVPARTTPPTPWPLEQDDPKASITVQPVIVQNGKKAEEANLDVKANASIGLGYDPTIASGAKVALDFVSNVLKDVGKRITGNSSDSDDPQNGTRSLELKKVEVARDERQYNPHCDHVESYRYGRNWIDGQWVVAFRVNGSLHQSQNQNETGDVENYVIRIQRRIPEEGKDENEIKWHANDVIQFFVVPWNPNYHDLAIQNLDSGEYIFRICAVTAEFTPPLLDTKDFAWANDAESYHVNLNEDFPDLLKKGN